MMEDTKLENDRELKNDISDIILDNDVTSRTDKFNKQNKGLVIANELVAVNQKAEADAILNYYRLLANPLLSNEQRDKIEEIIADEKNHQIILLEIQYQLDGIKPNKD